MDSLDNIVRRIDYELRNKIIGLKTEIYRVENFKHVIVPLNNKNNLDEIKKTLEKIRIMGVFLKIVDGNEVEGKKIQSFENGDIVSDFKGLVYNDEGLWNFLTSRFHKIDFKDLKYKHDPRRKFVVKISDETSEEEIKELEKFITTTVQFAENTEILKVSSNKKPKRESKIDREYECKKKGAEFWFENATKIYNDELKKEDISFFDKDTSKCSLNASVFQNVDIRNLILLYDEIYLEPPIKGHMNEFLKYQNMREDEFIELANKGKLKLMLSNEIVGYDRRVLDAINSSAPNSMWDSKMINSILASDFVEMEKTFF